MTIRRAIDNLVKKGLLYKIPKKGTFVADPKQAATKTTKTKNLGYFLDRSIKDGLSSPYYSMVFDALEKEAGKYGYSMRWCRYQLFSTHRTDNSGNQGAGSRCMHR